ncbi:MAG: fumarylacetoacetate hydrolase family protein [Methylocapsa sp.]|nr:fumarylacetoacetate hydrolase family protein [Methylocapsa sp.]
MSDYAFAPPPLAALPAPPGTSFPVRRIFCVGQNYRDHAKEMGGNPDEEPPFFFMKPASAIVHDGAAVPYPAGTRDLQHEAELVVAISGGGRNIAPERANELIFGYATGLDMTKRDLQTELRKKGRPWEMAKSFDCSAPCSAITPKAKTGALSRGGIECKVNGVVRQRSDLSAMIWPVAQIIAFLSREIEIAPGDLIFTGTPAGVGPVVSGDRIEAAIEGLAALAIEIVEAQSFG